VSPGLGNGETWGSFGSVSEVPRHLVQGAQREVWQYAESLRPVLYDLTKCARTNSELR
jgi:hypothetical protein